MEEFILMILENPLYVFLFGGGGILVVMGTFLGVFYKKRKKKKEEIEHKNSLINIGINVESAKISSNNSNLKTPDNANRSCLGNNYNFRYEDIEIEEEKIQKKAEKSLPLVLSEEEARSVDNNFSFSDDEYYECFLKEILIKKRGGDKIDFI